MVWRYQKMISLAHMKALEHCKKTEVLHMMIEVLHMMTEVHHMKVWELHNHCLGHCKMRLEHHMMKSRILEELCSLMKFHVLSNNLLNGYQKGW